MGRLSRVFQVAPHTLNEVFIGDFDADGDSASCDDGAFCSSPTHSGLGERRLTRRGKLARGFVSVGLLAIVLLALVGGTNTVQTLFGQLLDSLTAAPIAAAAPQDPTLLRADVPVGGGQLLSIKVRPVNGPGNFAYTCWITQSRLGLPGSSPTLSLALYSADREEWTTLPAPTTSALTCDVVPDIASQRRALLMVTQRSPTGTRGCALPDLYRTENWGMTWELVPWPATPTPPCQLQLALESGRLYALADRSLVPLSLLPREAGGHLFVSPDTGRTWQAADVGLAGIRDLTLVAFRPGGRVLACGTAPHAPDTTLLWQTADSGAHWQPLGAIPGQQMAVYASSDPNETGNGGWGHLFAAGLTDASSAPGGQGKPFLASVSNGTDWVPSILLPDEVSASAWSDVRLPPVPLEGPVRLAAGMPREMAVGPLGALVFARTIVGSGAQFGIARVDLLIWNGASWLKSRFSIPPNMFFQGVSWERGQMRIWLVPRLRLFVSLGQLLTFTIVPGQVP